MLLPGIDKFKSLTERRNAQDKAYMERLAEIVSRAKAKSDSRLADLLTLIAAFVASYYGDGSYEGAYAPYRGVTQADRLLSKIGKEIDALYNSYKDGFLDALGNEVHEIYLGTCYELQYDLGGWKPVSDMKEEQLSQIANAKWFDGQRFSDRLWADKRALKRALYRALINGIAQGKGLREMATDFKRAMAANQRVIERLIRTEYNRVVNSAIIAAYKANGVEWYEYVAIIDERTTETCESLNGKRFRVDSAEAGVNLPPMHPNCRSSTIPIGAATIGVDKATERLDYEQWLKKYLGA